MKKIAITLLLGYSLSFSADCEKMQIDELKYMKKEELIKSYELQKELLRITRTTIDGLREIARQAPYGAYKSDFDKYENTETCREQNITNIKRVLEKDFNVNESELNKLINSK